MASPLLLTVIMKTLFLSLGLIGLAGLAPVLAAGCDCTEVGCLGGLVVTVDGLLATHGDSLPLTIRVCADAACTKVTVSVDGSSMPTCTANEPAKAVCGSDFEKDQIEVTIDTELGDSVKATVTVEDQSGNMLYQKSSTGPTHESSPNGAFCGPHCVSGTAWFAVR